MMKHKAKENKVKIKNKPGELKEMLFFILLMLQGWLFIILTLGPKFEMRGLWLENYLINVCGGAIVIPILFLIYVTAIKFMNMNTPRFFRQLSGTIVFYLTAALTLGLFRITSWSGSIPRLLQAGVWGQDIAGFLIKNYGMVSTMFIGLAGVFMTAALYKIPLFSLLLKSPAIWIYKQLLDSIAYLKTQREAAIQEKMKQRREAEKLAELERLKQEKQAKKYEAADIQAKAIKKLNPEKILSSESTANEEETEVFPELNSFSENKTSEEDMPTVEEMLKTSLATAKDIPVDARLQNKPKVQPKMNASEEAENDAANPIYEETSFENMAVYATPNGFLKHLEEDVSLAAGQEIPPDPELPVESTDYSIAGLFPPPIEVYGAPMEELDSSEIEALANSQGEKIIETLQNFSIKSNMAEIVIGPSVIQFQVDLAPGIRVNKISGLANDLAMALAVVSVRVEAPIPGKPYVGIEIPNTRRRGIPLRSVIESQEYQESKSILPLPLGMRVDSRYMVAGLEEMPHLLVAGTTGSGKSVFTNTCILGICSKRTPSELRLILVDPKHVEFAIYDGLPHLLSRPISEPKKAVSALAWAVQEMESRSQMFALAKVRNLESYNAKLLPKSRLPYITIVVDELADLMYTAGKEVEALIARLAQKARSAGIHMILATQRPSVDVITGLIKANIPARIAFAVPSQTDSRTIIDTAGADKLLGKGDMLFLSTRYPRPVRLQASFIDEKRTMSFIECLKQSFGQPEYIEFEDYKEEGKSNSSKNNAYENSAGMTLDPKTEEAISFIMESGIASASKLQTIMGIGYPRASRIISTLEQLGILGPQPSSPSKPREILMSSDEAFQIINESRV
jgi:S-DNA-T family DNA segregation ATPase FtsK/SpoIIIE